MRCVGVVECAGGWCVVGRMGEVGEVEECSDSGMAKVSNKTEERFFVDFDG